MTYHESSGHPLTEFQMGESELRHLQTKASSPPRRRQRGGVGRFLTEVLRRWQRNRTIAALESLEDWMLDDIGVTRAQIPQIAEATVAATSDEIMTSAMVSLMDTPAEPLTGNSSGSSPGRHPGGP